MLVNVQTIFKMVDVQVHVVEIMSVMMVRNVYLVVLTIIIHIQIVINVLIHVVEVIHIIMMVHVYLAVLTIMLVNTVLTNVVKIMLTQ